MTQREVLKPLHSPRKRPKRRKNEVELKRLKNQTPNKKSTFILIISLLFSQAMTQTTTPMSPSPNTPSTPRPQTNCIVDKCAVCPSRTAVLCTACENGWYKINFSSGDKPYDACWSVTALWLAILAGALLLLLIAAICYYCYLIGKRSRHMIHNRKSYLPAQNKPLPVQQQLEAPQPTNFPPQPQPQAPIRQPGVLIPTGQKLPYSNAPNVIQVPPPPTARYLPSQQPAGVVRRVDPTSIVSPPRSPLRIPASQYNNTPSTARFLQG